MGFGSLGIPSRSSQTRQGFARLSLRWSKELVVPTEGFPTWKSSSHFSEELLSTDFGNSDVLGRRKSGWVQRFPPWMIRKLGPGVCFGIRDTQIRALLIQREGLIPLPLPSLQIPKENQGRTTISTIPMLQLLFADRI